MDMARLTLVLAAVAALVCSTAAQPTLVDIEFSQTIISGAYNYTLVAALDWTDVGPIPEGQSEVYFKVVIPDGDSYLPAAGEGANGSFPVRDDLESFTQELTIQFLQMNKTGGYDAEVWLSYDTAFKEGNFTSNPFSVWAIPAALSVLPAVVTLGLAIATQDVIISLFLGIFSASLVCNPNPLVAWLRVFDYYIVGSFHDVGHVLIIMFSWFLAGMVAVMSRSGGAHGLAEKISCWATNRRSALLLTAFITLLIAYDDYSCCLITGGTMRTVTDGMMISREKLAFMVDSGAAPVASMSPISAWVGFEVSQIELGLETARSQGLDPEGLGYEMNSFVVFLHTIPLRFYSIYMYAMIWLVALLGRDYGPMLLAERRAMKTGRLYAATANLQECEVNNSMDPAEDTPRRWWNGLVPIVLIILLTLLGLMLTGTYGASADGAEMTLPNILSYADSFNALLYSTFTTGILLWVMYRVQYKAKGRIVAPWSKVEGKQPLMTISESMKTWIEGIRNLMAAIVTLLLAWGIGMAIRSVGCDLFISDWLASSLDPRALPCVTFLIASVLSLATGTSWGTMSIVMPLVIPAIIRGAPGNMMLFNATVAGVLAGAVWGDHCTPISDTTILSAMACKCDLRHHVVTQLPYAISMGIVSVILGYLPVGYITFIPGWLTILVCNLAGIAFTVGILFVIGRPVSGTSMDLLNRLLRKKEPDYGPGLGGNSNDDDGFRGSDSKDPDDGDNEDEDVLGVLRPSVASSRAGSMFAAHNMVLPSGSRAASAMMPAVDLGNTGMARYKAGLTQAVARRSVSATRDGGSDRLLPEGERPGQEADL